MRRIASPLIFKNFAVDQPPSSDTNPLMNDPFAFSLGDGRGSVKTTVIVCACLTARGSRVIHSHCLISLDLLVIVALLYSNHHWKERISLHCKQRLELMGWWLLAFLSPNLYFQRDTSFLSISGLCYCNNRWGVSVQIPILTLIRRAAVSRNDSRMPRGSGK